MTEEEVKQEAYMIAATDIAQFISRGMVSGWDIKRLATKWADHMAQMSRKFDENFKTPDNPAQYIRVLEVSKVRSVCESDKGERKFTLEHSFSRASAKSS